MESGRYSDEKSRIARLTAGLIEDGQTVILDGGSTVAAVARELAGKSLHIVTNSLPIAERLEALRNIELTLTGGYLDPRIRVMLGPLCEQMLGPIRADAVIMGIGGITEAGFSNNNTLVVGSEQKMIEVASRVIIVADHTKFGRGGMIPVAPLEDADTVVSDSELAARIRGTAARQRHRSAAGVAEAVESCHFFAFYMQFVRPHPLPSPLGADGCVSGLLCGGQRNNTHNGDLGSKRFGISRLRGARLAKIFIALRLRIKHSGHKG